MRGAAETQRQISDNFDYISIMSKNNLDNSRPFIVVCNKVTSQNPHGSYGDIVCVFKSSSLIVTHSSSEAISHKGNAFGR